MIKKIGIFLITVVLVIFVYGYIYDNQRLKGIFSITIGIENQKYIKKIDQEIAIGGPISIETYVFKILDKNKINCNEIPNMSFSKEFLIHLDKDYINKNQKYCEKYINDKLDRTIQLIIQDKVFIINIFID